MTGECEKAYAFLLTDWRRLALVSSSLLARLPTGAVYLGLILAVGQGFTSLKLGALTSAVCAGASAVFNPARGRSIDRLGASRAVKLLTAANVLSLCIVVVAITGGNLAGTLVSAGVVGATMPPIGQATRTYWRHHIESRLVEAAYSVEAGVQELAYLLGPLIVSAAVLAGAPTVSLLVSAAVVGCGGFTVARLTNQLPIARRDASRSRVLHDRAVLLLVFASVLEGACLGAVQVAAASFAESRGESALAGTLLAVVAGGSALAGVGWGARQWTWDIRLRGSLVAGCLSLALAALAATASIWWTYSLMFVGGMAFAPLGVCLFLLCDAVVDSSRINEAQSWLGSSYLLGLSAGNGVAALLVAAHSGPPLFAALLAISVIPLLFALPAGAAEQHKQPVVVSGSWDAAS
jgi:MFS family permease